MAGSFPNVRNLKKHLGTTSPKLAQNDQGTIILNFTWWMINAVILHRIMYFIFFRSFPPLDEKPNLSDKWTLLPVDSLTGFGQVCY